MQEGYACPEEMSRDYMQIINRVAVLSAIRSAACEETFLIFRRFITIRLQFPYDTLSSLCMRSHQSRRIGESTGDAAY